MTVVTQHIKPSTHTSSNYFVNEISSPSPYTNTDGYTLSYYIYCVVFSDNCIQPDDGQK